MFNGWHIYIQRFTFMFNGWHFRSTNCNLPNLIIWSSNFARVIERFFDAAKAKSNMWKKGMAIERAMIFRCKICWILSNVILGQFLFENQKRPFKNLVSDVLKLKSCLDSPVRGHTFITSKKKFFFEKADPPNPHIDIHSKFICEKNFCQLKINPF